MIVPNFSDVIFPSGRTQASPGVIANPFAAGIVRKNSMESISSIDRDLSPEEIDIMQKVQDAVQHSTLGNRP